MEIGDLSGNLIPSILPTTDRGTEVKEDSYVKQLQSQIRIILVNIRIGGGPQHSYLPHDLHLTDGRISCEDPVSSTT